MNHRRLELLFQNENPWISIKEPAKFREKIMNAIGRKIHKNLFILKVLKKAALSLFSLFLLLSALLLLKGLKPTKMVFLYPDSDKIKKVEVVGNFSKKNEKVRLSLEKEKGIWEGEVNTYKKNVEYVINVEEDPDSNGSPGPEDTEDKAANDRSGI